MVLKGHYCEGSTLIFDSLYSLIGDKKKPEWKLSGGYGNRLFTFLQHLKNIFVFCKKRGRKREKHTPTLNLRLIKLFFPKKISSLNKKQMLEGNTFISLFFFNICFFKLTHQIEFRMSVTPCISCHTLLLHIIVTSQQGVVSRTSDQNVVWYHFHCAHTGHQSKAAPFAWNLCFSDT